MKQATHFTVQRGWKLLISDMGLNPADVLKPAGLPADLFSRKDANLSPGDYFKLWSGLEQAAGTEELPLKIGQAISVEAFDPPIFASLCSPNLNTALQRLAQFKRLIGPMVLTVDIGKHHASVAIDCYGQEGQLPRSLGAAELVFFTALARLTTRQQIVPADVVLVQPPENPAPFEAYFGTAIRAGEVNRILFSARDANRPFLTADTAMWEFFEAGLEKRLSDLDAEAGIVQRVRSTLLEMLPSGHSSIEDAARRLAMSKRSLQRRLSDEASSYKEILNATRRELAQHYLARSSISWRNLLPPRLPGQQLVYPRIPRLDRDDPGGISMCPVHCRSNTALMPCLVFDYRKIPPEPAPEPLTTALRSAARIPGRQIAG